MKSMTQLVLETVEETRKKYLQEVGKHHKNDKKRFINWYLENHSGNFDMLISDLSEYYLFISEATIIKYLKE